MKAEGVSSLARYKFQNYVKEIYYDSDTSLALLSGAPFDDPTWWFLSNEQIAKARELINGFAGSRRLLAHSLITPKQPGWMDEVDKAIAVHKPEFVEGLHDRRPAQPVEVPVAARRREADVSVLRQGGEVGHHHDLHPQGAAAARLREGVRRRVGVRDRRGHRQGRQGLAADELRDLSRLPCARPSSCRTRRGRSSSRPAASAGPRDLAEIPQKFGVTNVYAELGTSFANSAVAHPKFCAALVGTLIKGMGADHVLWGTDSVWYGSPQWQIEAMRRLEIPEDMQKKYGFAALGDANSATKQQIFSGNAARMYNIPVKKAENTRMPAFSEDRFAALKKEYALAAAEPSNLRYGYVRSD